MGFSVAGWSYADLREVRLTFVDIKLCYKLCMVVLLQFYCIPCLARSIKPEHSHAVFPGVCDDIGRLGIIDF